MQISGAGESEPRLVYIAVAIRLQERADRRVVDYELAGCAAQHSLSQNSDKLGRAPSAP
jgi:hypothetical protein